MLNRENQPEYDLSALRALVEHRPEDLPGFLQGIHSADLADWLQSASADEREHVFSVLDAEDRAELFQFSTDEVATDLVGEATVEDLVDVVEHLPADDVVDLLALANQGVAEEVLDRVDIERAEGLRRLSMYESDTAGGLMTTEFATLPEGVRVGDAIKALRMEDERTIEEEAGIFVVDGAGRPVGWVSDRDLVTTPIHTDIEEVMAEIPTTVGPMVDQEEAAMAVSRYNLQALAVVDEEGVLLGVITAEDASDVFEEEAEEDIRKLVGTSTEAQTHLPVLRRVRQRLPMQALTVLGGLATAHILRLAMPAGEGSVTSDLLRYIPIIIGLAGNVGIQASTILVRAFATGEVTPEREGSVLVSEVLTGMLIGVLCGVATAVVASLTEGGIDGQYAFGAAVGTSVAIAVTWASFLGSIIPMGCRRTNIDPAIVAGPFLITLSDISGTSIFMLSAHLILEATG
ncbi:MAG: magnesium transporter [Planctomycetota bacterium]|nr:magnesium transporter [Planctomycetota bacterium]